MQKNYHVNKVTLSTKKAPNPKMIDYGNDLFMDVFRYDTRRNKFIVYSLSLYYNERHFRGCEIKIFNLVNYIPYSGTNKIYMY